MKFYSLCNLSFLLTVFFSIGAGRNLRRKRNKALIFQWENIQEILSKVLGDNEQWRRLPDRARGDSPSFHLSDRAIL